jgi:hypothetical protein
MLKNTLLCLITIMALNTKSQTLPPYVVPNVDWIKYYSQTDAVVSSPTALDANSNVYQTGYSGLASSSNLIALKYDSTGVLTYSYSYNNGGQDNGLAIKVGPTGIAYIAGLSAGTAATGLDYVIIKLLANGAVAWVKRWDRGITNPANTADQANDICIDPVSGNVYVTGKSKNASGNFDVVTLKLNGLNGSVLWSHIYAGSGLDDEGTGIVLSPSGAIVYITGNTINSTTGSNIVTYALNANTGLSQWSPVITNGSANGIDKAKGIITLGTDIAVCGEITNNTTGTDYFLRRYNGNTGATVFTRQYDFASTNNRATAIARDSAGNIGITGIALNGTIYQYHTVLYTNSGTQTGVNIESTGLTVLTVEPKICNDTIAHHWILAGEVLKTTKDMLVYQVTPTANTAWRKTIDSQNNDVDCATGVAVNGIGVVYVGGRAKNSSANYDFTTTKISQTPVYFPPDLGTPELNDNNFVFETNQGQLLNTNLTPVSSANVAYFNQGSNPSHYFSNMHMGYVLKDKDAVLDSLARVDLKIVSANSLSDIYRYDPIDAKKNYFTTAKTGMTDIVSYKRLFIPNVLPNVDLHHYSNSAGLKSYFVFKTPAASLPKFRLQVDGAASHAVNAGGYLIATTALGNVNMGKLAAYQATFNTTTQTMVQMPLTVTWNSLGGNQYNFNVSGYIPFWPIVVYVSKPGATSAVAPTQNGNLYWSTYVGGQGADYLYKSKVDAKDNYYVGGSSTAIDYPVAGLYIQQVLINSAGVRYGVMSKFDNVGKIKYSTYYGGPNSNCNPAITEVLDVVIDSIYNIYMVGYTTSTDLRTQTTTVTGALNYTANAALSGTAGLCTNAFIAKLNPTGNVLRYASYYGGTNQDKFYCAGYKNGQIFIGGYSGSPTIPLVSPLPNTYQITTGQGMYIHIDTTGFVRHSTKMQYPIDGGDVDKNGNFYMICSTSALNPLTLRTPAGSFYSSGSAGQKDWGIQRMSQADSLTWSTNFGGASNDTPTGICVRDTVMAICGYGTSNSLFPFLVAPTDSGQTVAVNLDEIQLAKFNIKTGQRLWAAYHATGNIDYPYGITLDKNYNLYVTGYVTCPTSTSAAFPSCPTTGFRTLQAGSYYQQNTKNGQDGFVLAYNNKNQRRWTTYFGNITALAPDFEYARTIAVNNNNKLFIAGYSSTPNSSIPLSRWNSVCYYDSTYASGGDGFVSMFDMANFTIVDVKENSKITINNDLLLYPNPNSGIFTIKFLKPPHEKVSLHVVNTMGAVVYEKNNMRVEEAEITFDFSSFANGVYLMRINDGQKTSTVKMIKQ